MTSTSSRNSRQNPLPRLMRAALVVGGAGAVLCAAAGFFWPQRFFPAYLVAFWFWLGLSLGALAINLLHHLTGGGWGVPIRRILESAAGALGLMAALFLPILFGMRHLYAWSDAAVIAEDEILRQKSAYLNVNGFWIRAAVYFGVWILWALLLNLGTATSDLELQRRRERGMATFSGWGLVFWGLSVTFAAIDWAMSIEPHWYSSMYGVLYIAGQGVSAMAGAILVAILLAPHYAHLNPLTTARQHDLANFLLAFVMFWSYVSLMQFLIIWSANLPEETPWYLARSRGGWQAVVGLLAVLHFVVPFFVLLLRQVKRVARRLMAVAVLLLVMRFVDLCWLILPPFIPTLIGQSDSGVAGRSSALDLWPILLTMPAIGGLWIAFFAFILARRGEWPVAPPQSALEPEHASPAQPSHAH